MDASGRARAGAGTRDLLRTRLSLIQGHIEVLRRAPVGGSYWLGHDPEMVRTARSNSGEDDYSRALDALDYRASEEAGAVTSVTLRTNFAIAS
jgi:hypothetical protein